MSEIFETEMLNVKQVAQMYGKSPNTIWVWTRNNKIPHPTYIGGSTLWSRRQIEADINGRKYAMAEPNRKGVKRRPSR